MTKNRLSLTAALAFAILSSGCAMAPRDVAPAVYTDPIAVDAKFGARNQVVGIPTQGVNINGLMMVAAGPGLHPTMVLLHGVPGNEKNLDLAQSVRRAGWNVLTLNYRGSWGSPGAFTFGGNLKDADAALAFVRDPANQKEFGIDPARVALAGHSMGGWVTGMTAAHDKKLAGAIMFSMANMGGERVVKPDRAAVVKWMAGNFETLAGTTPERMADEVIAQKPAYDLTRQAANLRDTRLLMITSNDGYGPESDALASSIVAAGNRQLTQVHIPTNHSYTDSRIRLESTIIAWLEKVPAMPQ